MKHLFLLFNFALLSLHSYSQVENFDISKYKLPDIKRQQLDFFFHSSGQNSSSKLYYENENYRDTLKNENDQFNGNYNFGYSYYRNSKRVQSTLNAFMNGDYSKIKQNRTNYYSLDYSYSNNNLSGNYDLKYFFAPTNWFVTAAPNYVLNYRNYNDFNTDTESKDLITEAYLKVGGGKGRIEQVQDFRHAILLIEEFDKRGVSKRNISETEIIELSTLISQLKNKRFFDYRKQKQAELVVLDSFFVNKGIIDKGSIAYFVGLEDIWSYGGLQIRETGQQVLFSVTPGYNYFKAFDEDENNIDENLSINYYLVYVSKNPISIKWQANYDGGISHTYFKRLQQQKEYATEKSYVSSAFLNGQVGYYPNTRTYFDLSCKLNLFNRSEEKTFDNEKYAAALQIATSGYYYISEKLRLGYSIRYETTKFGIFNSSVENTYHKTLSYTLDFNYAIF